METPSKVSATSQSTPADESNYDPPQVEVVVTADELERESLYAGAGIYGVE